jgi:hypothetical protein
VTRSASAAEPCTESDEKAAGDDCDEARGHLRLRHRIADERSSKRSRDEAGNERRAPGAVARLRVDEAVENAADAGDAAGEQHQQDGRKPDQRAADCSGDRSKIGHDITSWSDIVEHRLMTPREL